MAIAVLATLLLSALISTWLQESVDLYIPSFATIKTSGIKAYWDVNLTNETTGLPWSTVYPGNSTDKILFLQSVSNVKTKLELRTTNWTFRDSNNTIVLGPVSSTDYLNLTWNYNNATIVPRQAIQVTLTLSADKSDDFIWFLVNNDVKEFSFDVVISAHEHS